MKTLSLHSVWHGWAWVRECVVFHGLLQLRVEFLQLVIILPLLQPVVWTIYLQSVIGPLLPRARLWCRGIVLVPRRRSSTIL